MSDRPVVEGAGLEPLVLRVDRDDAVDAAWVVETIAEVAAARNWSSDPGRRPDAVIAIVPIGTAITPLAEPLVSVQVEAGTPRSPVAEESPPHLPPRLDLTVGAFRARRNQRTTRDALERFFARVEQARPAIVDLAAPTGTELGPATSLDPAEAVAAADAAALIDEHRALLDAVDEWLACTTMTPEAAQAVHADRAIVDAAIRAPVIDLVILERAATRLAALLDP